MKVGIIGCGISGAYLAWKLSRKHEVYVFEKKSEIGKTVCSGLISTRIINFIPFRESLIRNRIKNAVVHFPKRNINLELFPEMFVVNHEELDKYVVNFAERSGAKIFLNSELVKIENLKSPKVSLKIDGSTKKFDFDYVVGCDGPMSVTRKQLNIRDPKFRLGIYTYVNKDNLSDTIDIYPLKHGFAWKIPRDSKVEYGTLEKVETAKKDFETFCKKMKIKPKDIQSALIPQGLVPAFKGNVALCGDAIGLTKPISGGGIIWDLMASDILLKYFPNFKKYNEELKRFFDPRILFSKIATDLAVAIGNSAPSLIPRSLLFDTEFIY